MSHHSTQHVDLLAIRRCQVRVSHPALLRYRALQLQPPRVHHWPRLKGFPLLLLLCDCSAVVALLEQRLLRLALPDVELARDVGGVAHGTVVTGAGGVAS